MSTIASKSNKLGTRSLRKKLKDVSNALAANVASPTTTDLARLADASGTFAWLEEDAEDIYTTTDGTKAQWPKKRTRKAA